MTAVLNYWDGLYLFLFSSLSCFFLLRFLLLRVKVFFFFLVEFAVDFETKLLLYTKLSCSKLPMKK